MADYTLHYWKVEGRGEQVRLLFAAAGVEYDNHVIGGPEFGELKKRDGIVAFGYVPVLETKDGFALSNGPTIIGYLARKFKLIDASDLEKAALADSIAAAAEDFRIKYFSIFKGSDEEKAAAAADLVKLFEDRWGVNFEALLKKSGTGFFVGDSLTHADIAVWDVLNASTRWVKGFPEALKKFDLLSKHQESIANNANLKKYLESRDKKE